MKFFPLFKLWARWFDGRRIFSVSRCVGISAARRDSSSAGRQAVCRKRWDLLTLTPMGCALLPEPAAVTAGILLLPGDCPRSDLRAGTVVTYGLSPRDSITLSSLREPVLCVQRTLPLLCGGVLEPQEFPLPGVEGAERLLPGVGTRLLWTGSPYPL